MAKEDWENGLSFLFYSRNVILGCHFAVLSMSRVFLVSTRNRIVFNGVPLVQNGDSFINRETPYDSK